MFTKRNFLYIIKQKFFHFFLLCLKKKNSVSFLYIKNGSKILSEENREILQRKAHEIYQNLPLEEKNRKLFIEK